MAEIDTNAETIAQVCRNLTDDRSPTGYDRWFIAALIDSLRAKLAEAERERDEAQDAIRREVTAANLQFFSRKTDELGAALLKAEAAGRKNGRVKAPSAVETPTSEA